MSNKFKMISRSKAVMSDVDKVMLKAITEACLLVQGQAKLLAPVGNGTGELRDKIDYNTVQNGSQIIGQVGSPMIYAPYVEFGTGEYAENGGGRKGGWTYRTPDGKYHFTLGMRHRPFLRPAFRSNSDNIKKILASNLKNNFKK